MSKPVGVGRALKDNSNKHPQQRDEWNEGKRIGRKKQVWVVDSPKGTVVATGTAVGMGPGTDLPGHWEKA